MARHVQIWALALVVAATGCTNQQTTEPDPPTNASTTSSSRLPTLEPQLVTSTTQVAQTAEPVQTTATTLPTSTTTTEAPTPATPVIGEIETGDLDILVDELSAILTDLEMSLAEEEGDVFND